MGKSYDSKVHQGQKPSKSQAYPKANIKFKFGMKFKSIQAASEMKKAIHNALKKPVVTVHERQKPFKCLTCDASFTQRGSLKTHIETIHEEQKLYNCDICDAGFTQMQKLKGHVATVHEGQKPVKCSICDASFSQRESMNKHFLSFHKNQIRSVKDIR